MPPFRSATPWNQPYRNAALFPSLAGEPGSVGPRSSGDSLPPLECNRRTVPGRLRTACDSRNDCTRTTAANSDFSFGNQHLHPFAPAQQGPRIYHRRDGGDRCSAPGGSVCSGGWTGQFHGPHRPERRAFRRRSWRRHDSNPVFRALADPAAVRPLTVAGVVDPGQMRQSTGPTPVRCGNLPGRDHRSRLQRPACHAEALAKANLISPASYSLWPGRGAPSSSGVPCVSSCYLCLDCFPYCFSIRPRSSSSGDLIM